jgi:uncharacterized protein
MTHVPARVIRLSDVAPMAWKNRAGVTRELLAWPNPEHWAIRVSVAEISSSAAFSAFQNIDRWFAVISGAGVRLSDGIGAVRVGDAPIRFDGALAPKCQLIDDITQDLNVMIDRARGRGRFKVLRDCARVDFEYIIDINDTTVAGAFCAAACEIVDDEAVLEVPPMSMIWTDCKLPSPAPLRIRTEQPDRVWVFTFLESLAT